MNVSHLLKGIVGGLALVGLLGAAPASATGLSASIGDACPLGMICNRALGLALTLPPGWQMAPPDKTPPGRWALEVPAPAGQANSSLRLEFSLLGTTPDPDAARAAATGMDAVLRSLGKSPYNTPVPYTPVTYGGVAGVLLRNLPVPQGGVTVATLAHGGAVYQVLAPGPNLAADQQRALESVRFVGPAPAPRCRFILGFAALERMLPRQVGFCLDGEQHNPTNGDGLQHTTGGLMVWRKSDSWTAFTDGYRTWVNGPHGLDARLNTQRFPWEANIDGLPVVPDNPYGPRTPTPPAGPTLKVVLPQTAPAGTISLPVTGSGFAPGETVTLRGSSAPDFLVQTGKPEAPVRRVTCSPQPLGPVEATADRTGSFTATVEVIMYPGTAFDISLIASGATSGKSVSGGTGGGTLPVLNAAPAGCLA